MSVARPQVSIRLGTTGRSDVEKDLAGIGDVGDAQAKRYQASWERASASVEAALERQAKAAARLESTAATPIQRQINQVTGVSSIANDTGAARASAVAIAAQLDAGEAAAKRLLAAVDPLYAAQMRYDQALAEANALQRQGLLVGDAYVKVTGGLKTQLDDQVQLLGHIGDKSGTARLAQMEFMHVVRGSADALAAGAPPGQVFAMHLGMLSQAAQLAGGSLGKVGEFLSSGWGMALTIAVAVAAPMLAKLLQMGDAVDDLTDKLKKDAQQERDGEAAQRQFAGTLDGVTKAVHDNAKALKGMADAGKSAEQQALANALAEAEKAKRIRESTLAIAQQAEANLKNAQAVQFGAGGAASAYGAQSFFQQQVDTAHANVQQAQQNLADSTAQVIEATSRLSVKQIEDMADPVNRIKARYEGPGGLIEAARAHAQQLATAAKAAGDEAKAQALVTTELQKQIGPLKAKEQAEVDAYQKSKHGDKNAGGTAIFDQQIAAFFDEAAKFRGKSETGDKGVLEAFFKEAHLNLDPEKTAWCAAFVNAVLANQGVKGTGSLAARSFLNFGKDDTHSPQRGDIVVVKSSASPSGSHVGFLDSIDAKGNVRVLGGNTGNKVGTLAASARDVLAIRRPPTPSESAAADDKAATAAERLRQQALEAQGTFDSERQKLNQQYLQALGKIVAGYDAQATVQLMRAQGEHDAEAQQISTNLAEGKYGIATGQLAQTRAKQLQAANDAALKERQAAIALDTYVKGLEARDAANERDTRFQLDGLQYQESIARTAGERRRLAQQIIDIEYQEKEKHLQYLLALDNLLGKTEDAADVAAQLAHLPAEKARASDQADRANRSPFQDYLQALPQTWADVGEAIEKDGVNALQDFTDGLANAIVQGKSLGDVLHNAFAQLLTDLIKLGEQEALHALFGGGQQQGGGSGAGGLLGSLMSLFGGAGGGAGSAAFDFGGGDFMGSFASAPLPTFATGTEYFRGGTAWVGEHGPEMVRLPGGSKIHNAADSRRMAAANDVGIGSIHIPITIDATGADAAGLDRVHGELQQLRSELPSMIAQHWVAANDRFMFRGARR